MKLRVLVPTALLSALALSWGVQAETYSPGSADDPRIRASRFLGADERYFSAITELLKLQRSAGAEFEASPEYWAALAEYNLSFGMRDRAEQMYRSVPAASADPLVAAQARLRLAEFSYERGYLDEARASLLRQRERLPDELAADWSDLYSRVLMAQGRYNEAVGVLEKIEGEYDQAAFMRYNLGVALINDGQLAAGRQALDRVGRHPGNTELIRSLRDRANTTLGWHFLQNQLGGSAKPVLSRVRSEGLYANRALLGVGWAEIAPQGQRQRRGELAEDQRLRELNDPFSSFSSLGILLRRGYLDDPYERAGIRTFRRQSLAKNEEAALRRALDVWSLLLDRDPQDPAVQESWLAVPFALDRLGAHVQAQQYYEQAAERLEAARKRTALAIQAVNGGRMVETVMLRDADSEAGWRWELRDLPDAPETYYLQSLIAEHRYAESLKNYRDLRFLNRTLEAWKGRLVKMDASLGGSSTATLEPATLFQRAKRNWRPEHEPIDLPLEEASTLAAPGTFTGRGPDVRAQVPPLRLSAMPAKFDGPGERLSLVRTRTNTLQPLIAASQKEAASRLQKLALDELNLQKATIDKYLVESRFALARIYDGALPDPDQDEFELDEQGKPVRQQKLQRGEFEVDKSKPLDAQLQRSRPSKAPTTRRGADEEVEVK
jgi:tetratricopeptide (TPR) repeat protein